VKHAENRRIKKPRMRLWHLSVRTSIIVRKARFTRGDHAALRAVVSTNDKLPIRAVGHGADGILWHAMKQSDLAGD